MEDVDEVAGQLAHFAVIPDARARLDAYFAFFDQVCCLWVVCRSCLTLSERTTPLGT